MRILIIGNGGREHCLAWKIALSPRVKKIFSAPGNAGMESVSERVDIPADDIDRLAEFALKEKIDLAVAGPEAPLALGITDIFRQKNIKIFGPSRRAAMLETSKIFCKDFLLKNKIPCASSEAFSESSGAFKYLKSAYYPLVVKADGLCAGKGVYICDCEKDAKKAVSLIMEDKIFKSAGDKILFEDFLQGEEVSFMVITDGENFIPLLPSQDHKSAYDGDRGPNTGGMGAYAPTKILNSHPKQIVLDSIIAPVIKAMADSGAPYRGLLYAGLMLTPEGPRVLEFNARFGDPETQAVLPLLKTDLIELLLGSAENTLKSNAAEWSSRSAVCVIMASGGYPGKYETGKVISGIDKAAGRGALIFHAGTQKKNGALVTSGGRVLGVTAAADTIGQAIDSAYGAVREIKFEGAYYREDIGWKALKHTG